MQKKQSSDQKKSELSDQAGEKIAVRDAYEEYLASIKHLAGKTQAWYANMLLPFVEWCESQSISLEDVNAKIFTAYVQHLQNTPITHKVKTGQIRSTHTVAAYGRALRAFLRWCNEDEDYEDAVSDKVVRRLKMPAVDKLIMQTYSKDDIDLLLKACEQVSAQSISLVKRDQTIIKVLVDTGIRAAELCELKIEDCCLAGDDPHLLVHGKGNKEREVPLGDTSLTALRRFIKHHRFKDAKIQYVFLTRYREQMTPVALDQMLYRLLRRCDVKDAYIHKFRHTYAVEYMKAGGDVSRLSLLLGHEDIQTTMVYLRAFTSKDARRETISVLDNM